jgi:glyoxylase-like metal-dependent hydrolase (beta-lactamase superfamily II)
MACYYIDGLLIDSGTIHVSAELAGAFSGLPIHTLVNTHHHEDHIGNNSWFQKHRKLGPALAHPLAVPIIEKSSPTILPLPEYRLKTWGDPPASRAQVIGSEIITENYRFKVLETPGHSPDHISLLEAEQGWLFAGDLYFGEKVIEIHQDEDPNNMLNSLMKLLQYDFEYLFCSSGKVLQGDTRQAILAKIAFWEEQRAQIRFFHKQGLEAEEIRDRLYGPETPLYEKCEEELGKIHLVQAFLKGIDHQ